MGWMNMLYDTYVSNTVMAGKTDVKYPLAVVAHKTANAQIELTVTKKGQFGGAALIKKENGKTLIPVTEASAARTNANVPHALCDVLPYVAGDYSEYADEKMPGEKFRLYSEALENWAQSKYSDDKVKAVYSYITGKTMVANLVESGILELDENGRLSDKKINGVSHDKLMVRFRVRGTFPDAVWQDPHLFELYTKYYNSIKPGVTDVCYVNGKSEVISKIHPKGIVASNYGAKLISSNDTENFTYRGRFAEPEQACTISYEASQKAHNALSWLVANQGVTVGSRDKRTYVCWNPKGKEIMQPIGDTSDDTEDDTDTIPNTEQLYKQKLYKTLAGYRNNISENDDIVIIALDAATTGRLSVVYYNELKASDFYDRIERWYGSCIWYFTKFTPEKKAYTEVETPNIKRIVNCAFGTERNIFLETDDKVFKEQFQRIFHCMIDAKPIPKDIVHYLYAKASQPLAFPNNRSIILSTACAVIRKYYNDSHKGEELPMELDLNNNDRSYLFGRILAIAEYVERRTYDNEKDKGRETNAIRLQAAFVQHPFSVWKSLESALVPYFQDKSVVGGTEHYFKQMLADIVARFKDEDIGRLNNPLGETYLLGYYLQCRELYKKREASNSESHDENSNN